MIVLGVHLGHDGSAAMVVDGVVMAAVGEERLSRRKSHLGFPWRAIPAVLKLSGVEPHEVQRVAISFTSYLNAPPFLATALLNEAGCNIPLDDHLGLAHIVDEVRRQWHRSKTFRIPYPNTSTRFRSPTLAIYTEALAELGIHAPVTPVDHHTAHAASCAYTSPFENPLVVTADGAGDGLSSTWSRLDGSRLKRASSSTGDFSLGKFYSAITKFLGFTPQRHEGKITGLAGFGDPEACRQELDQCISYDRATQSFGTLLPLRARAAIPQAYRFLRGRHCRDLYSEAVLQFLEERLANSRREDVAAAAQAILDDCLTAYVQDAARASGKTDVVAAGGVFANVRTNHLLAEQPEVTGLYVHPDMGDGGTALGAALYLTQNGASTNGHSNPRPVLAPPLAAQPFNPYLGPEYSDSEIRRALDEAGIAYRSCESIEAEMARHVTDGRIVGRFDGRMEYGPRALGHRSILADMRRKGVHDDLNRRLHRSEFMPFAPSVLEERAPRFLEGLEPRRQAGLYMTTCFNVQENRRAGLHGACHVDGTARAQLVRRELTPSFHTFLSEMERLTDFPMVLNTSFNTHEEPIVCSPADAAKTYRSGAIDVLAIGPYLAERD